MKAEVLANFDTFWEPWSDRTTVSTSLQDQPDGTFRVRPSRQDPTSRVLCVKFGQIVLHYLLERYDGQVDGTLLKGGVTLTGHTRVFRSLVDLLAFYSVKREALPCLLRSATSRAEQPSSRASLHTRHSSEALILVEMNPGSPRNEVGKSSSERRLTRIRRKLRRLRIPVPARWLPPVSQRISNHLGRLLSSSRTAEGRTVDSFVQCTEDAEEDDFHVVMRNIRQFLDGMRNFVLAQHGNATLIGNGRDTQSKKVALLLPLVFYFALWHVAPGALPSIIEMILQNRIVPRLHQHVYKLIINHFQSRQGDLAQFKANLTALQRSEPEDIGLNPKLARIQWKGAIVHLERMQTSPSPVSKLQELLFFVDTVHAILDDTRDVHNMEAVGADDMLPLIVHIIILSRISLFEAEAEYMWGLLDPALLNGEGGYYLTTLSSAIHVIKTFNVTEHGETRLDADAKPQLLKMKWPLDRRPGVYRMEFRHDNPTA
ncbi:hypothetical protein PTSG_09467 [Salpingoeca rosetta]|uniref:VPS9 domain-containing protein n=1 Tax=Salpingoeca rosetta (strain ATCC 50818 / BSB-021) TaxID=946362 RepID=F2UMQ0_SALR5|nr:uncharacterized protein PTSG_09467 [Salpingoeca rosetta]EGD78399.1 hypothetical protein PTSG_09467 [Salpingoeca rosetta]|eukprot:XP_004989722.1 hypothetical protein PTSG_09467 [Salpingoeca rosetta]